MTNADFLHIPSGPFSMIARDLTVSVTDALKIVLDNVTPLGPEDVSILDLPGRVLFDPIIADHMVPPWNNSAMDGYAMIAADSKGSSRNSPLRLRIAGEVQAGSVWQAAMENGTAVRIMTGAPIPANADCVIPIEDTEEDGGYVALFREVSPFENYRFAGESIKKGDVVLNRGERLGSAHMGTLASLNCGGARVYARPRVSIIATGNEVVEPGQNIADGQIRNINAYTLMAEAKKYGALPSYLGIARDIYEDSRKLFEKALDADVVISTGGVSMGKYDLVRDVYADLGIDIKFGWVKVKPGRPLTFGTKAGKLVFGLPGNPVSTLTSFIQFVRPALLSLMGARRIHKPVVNAILLENIAKPPGKAHYLRGRFTIKDNNLYVTTTGNQNSSIIRSMSDANCLIIMPEETTDVRSGEQVRIQLINHEEI